MNIYDALFLFVFAFLFGGVWTLAIFLFGMTREK